METPLVLERQKAEIVKALEGSGLSPAEFCWAQDASAQIDDGLASTIKFNSGDYFFRIDNTANRSWSYSYCPGNEKWLHGPEGTSYWSSVVKAAAEWARNVANELEAKSYLAIAMNSPQLLQLPELGDENSPFSVVEQRQLLDRLDRIESVILALRESDDEYAAEVKQNLHFLRDEVARGGRTAFRYALFGALLSIGLAFLGPDETRRIIDFATEQIAGLTHVLTHSSSE